MSSLRGFVPIDELVATLATSDVGVVAMKQNRYRDLTLAGKMFDYITMGVPMVVSTTRSVAETFPAGCFESFVSDDPSDLARAIQRLHQDPKLAMSYAKRAKDAAAPYSWPVQRRRYWEVVDALLDPAADGNLWRPLAGSESPDDGEPLAVTLTRRPDESALASWDELVRNMPGTDVAQLSAWADVRQTAGFEPLYVLVRRGAELVGGALVMSRRLPLIGEVSYVPYGPVIAQDTDREPVIAALVAALRQLADRRMRMLFVQPPLGGDDISLELRRHDFRPSQAAIAPSASLHLDLTRNEDELRAGLSERLQRWTRRWPARGVRVRHGTQDDVALLARLHAATARHQGFEPIPLDYLAILYRRLAPAGHAELFVGEIEGRPVGATPVHRLRRSTQGTPDRHGSRLRGGAVVRLGRHPMGGDPVGEGERLSLVRFRRDPRHGGVDTRGRTVRLVRADEFRGVQDLSSEGRRFAIRRRSRSSPRR